MEEEKKEQDRPLSLLERIKASIQRKNSEEGTEIEELAEPVNRLVPELPEEDTGSSRGRGVVNVSQDSLLFSIWKEWKEAVEESGEESKQNELEEEFDELEALELVLEESGTQKIPMSNMEIDTEKQRAAVQIMLQAKQYKKKTAPNEEGVVPDNDAYMVIHIAKKRMAAWAFVFPPSGEGKPLQRAQIYMALHEYSVTAGIDRDAIEHLVKDQPYFKLVPIAYGTPMIVGKDGSVIEKFRRHMEKTFAVNERGDVDYRIQNYIQTIHTGDVICEAVLPTDGTDGLDVLGTVIPAKNGKPAKLLSGQNTTLSEDKTKIVASMDGHLVFESGKFHVKPLFLVQGDVDFSVGNIDFLGDVHVRGDVREDFIIHATGNVTVDGIVEGALIDAGKDVIIAKGILGDEKAVITAGGNVQTEYIESCIIYAGDTVQASSIISSYVSSDNKITANVGRGTVIGGKLIAANLIDAKVIGCSAERVTTLVVGEKPYAEHKREEITMSLKEIAEEMRAVENMLGSVSHEIVETDPEKLQKAANYRLKKAVFAMQEAHLKKQLEEFQDTEVDFENSKIKANIIYPVTRIHIRDYACTVSEETTGCKIHLGEEGIELKY